jgi:GNAT superfamily N-acetyltransferase
MELTIKRLDPSLMMSFVSFFEGISFSHAPDWATCYCRFYFTECSSEKWDQRDGCLNRQESMEAIGSGKMKGYLAFFEDVCIGWCNANDIRDLKRISSDVEPYVKNEKIGCTICYVIHPDHRRKGIATELLKRAIVDFKQAGYDGMLALPSDRKDNREREYHGTYEMYERMGYEELPRLNGTRVMKLTFR